jgi:hypothetical protein
MIIAPHIKEYNVTHLFRTLALIHGHGHTRFPTIYFRGMQSPNTHNTRITAHPDLTLQVNVSERDSSKVCEISNIHAGHVLEHDYLKVQSEYGNYS